MDNTTVKNIVCIEDEPEMIELIRLILSRRGFDVHGAPGGKKGLDMVREMLPDLVLLDLMMPEMDGWEVYQQMKADASMRDIPVIGLHIAKVDDYIAKPFGPQELIDSVEKILNSKTSS
jgi:two-component system response regulator VicR